MDFWGGSVIKTATSQNPKTMTDGHTKHNLGLNIRFLLQSGSLSANSADCWCACSRWSGWRLFREAVVLTNCWVPVAQIFMAWTRGGGTQHNTGQRGKHGSSGDQIKGIRGFLINLGSHILGMFTNAILMTPLKKYKKSNKKSMNIADLIILQRLHEE